MRLSVEQVRDSKFHLARKNGYEPVDVDTFVDRVEETLTELYAELDALRSGAAAPAGASDEIRRLRADLDARDAQLRELRASGGKTEKLVLTSSADASSAVTRLLAMSTEQAERLVAEAKAEADKLRADAKADADKTVKDANAASADVTKKALERSEQLEATHAERKQKLDAELTQRRTSLTATLEREHAELVRRIEHLRAYEKQYRDALATELSGHLERVRTGKTAPQDEPELLSVAPGTASTPEFDEQVKPAS